MSALEITRDGQVATVTLSRPERRNALDPALLEGLAEAFIGLANEASVRVVVLRGAGPAFCAGADLDWMAASGDLSQEENVADADRMAAAFEAVDACPKAVVARVHGAAFGGGAGLVACADVSVAAEGTTFAFSEVRLGLLPATISPYILRSIGPGATRALFTTGRRFDADEARQLGLVHDVVSEDGLDASVAAVVRLAAGGRPRGRDRVQATCPSGDIGVDAGRPAGADRTRPHGRGRPRGRRGLPRAAEPVVVRRVLIANRGEIAVRLIQACRERGIESVVACTEGDLGSMAAGIADDVAPVTSYLDVSTLIAAGTHSGADAIHPGYGFLSEDWHFAEATLAADLVWIGPPPDAMRALADKERARELAERAGVPVVPGATGDKATLIAAARELGTPLLVKAAAGGGGRGMRAVELLEDLPAAIAAAQQEAAASFGDARVFLERRLANARHVEVQILADAHGNVIHLGERDCSLQRRHQKVVEESPSSVVSPDVRTRLGAAAVTIASAAGYVGAGTVEFLLLPDASFLFLEMNARLQVEHPITEAVTGVDLVNAQLSIADGEHVPLSQADMVLRGHAIEARVYAEDPANGFLPSGGRVERLHLPRWPGVRVDTALREGDAISLDFDPLLAKVIAFAEDRPACVRRLRAALEATEIVGVRTNLGFLLDILAHPDVVDARVDTDWIERTWRGQPPPLPDIIGAQDAAPNDPWYAFGAATTHLRDVVVTHGWAQYRGWAYERTDDELEPVSLPPPGGSLTAPMPGSVRSVHVAEGDRVAVGDAMVVLEAMKMQMSVPTPGAGTVVAVRVRVGDVVAAGQVLVEIEEEGS